jgi:hypothetical protein
MKKIQTTIVIDAPPGRVWAVLMDFGAYSSWNSFIPRIEGTPSVGSKLNLMVKPPGKPAARISPVVERYEPERLFAWRGVFGSKRLLAGAHSFRLTALGQGTRFDQTEDFSGLLVGLLGGTLKATELGFNGMNLNLKSRVENG